MGYGSATDTHARLLYLVVCVLATIPAATSSQYVWKTGRWRDCEHHACGAGGTRIRSVFCGKNDDNYYTETDDSKCSHLSKPKSMEECFKVCSFHHDKIKWAEPQFSDCILDPMYKECSVHRGIRFRNITCVWRDDGRLEDDSVCSEFAPKPDEQEKCRLKCPQDCVVSLYSPWQNCDTCIISNRTRTRSLIVPPANDGAVCPSFTEMIPCDSCKNTYTYHIGPWDDCARDNLYNSIRIHPLIGFQQRRIQCLNSYGVAVSYKKCLNYLRSTVTELTAQQTCIIPQDCVVSPYSSMISLNTSCYRQDGTLQLGYMIKTRKILQIPLGAGKPCPTLIRYFPVQTSDKKECPRTYWKMASWGECKAPHGGFPCTTGLQNRKAICVKKYGNNKEKPVAESECTERRPVTSQLCTAKCDLDCTLSQWTEWSECKVTDCELYLRRKRDNEGTGQRHRTRIIRTQPQGHGRKCSHLSETQICDPQPCYSWNMTVGSCRLLNPNSFPPCGLGIALRTLACVNKHGIRVSDTKCEELGDRPNPRQDCDIPCPNDCILSDWTPWSPCPNLCQEGRSRAAQRNRHRTILAQAGAGGKNCPMSRYLTEVQHCPTTIECAIYVWQTGNWRPCRVGLGDRLCGSGSQVRDIGCYSYPAGHPVPDQRCTLAVKPVSNQTCEVPCPVDCEVTEYSDWSPCNADCWEAKQTVPIKKRFRYIIQNPKYGGKACPNTLTETQQCTNLTFCESYYWDTEPWSKCYMPIHKIPQCGPGLRARNVSCRSENGTVQPVDICIKLIGPIPPVSQRCYKSCNAECVLGEWSEWSRCINGCNGNRYRTRKLIEDEKNPVIVKCKDRRLYPLDEQMSCLCDDHKPVPLGDWSECILESDDTYKTQNIFGAYVAVGDPTRETMKPPSRMGINSICGPGKSYKVLACQNDKGEVESAQRCSLKPYEEEVCLLPCPVDCVMSDWSHWTDCSTSCGTGSQMRYRHIKQIPSYGGRKCPSLDNAAKETQTRICVTSCREYAWRVYAWTACWPDQPDLRPCGAGTQSRNVRCEVETANGYTNEAVDEIMCSYTEKPEDRQACYAPCVGECVVSEWTQWSRCKQPCTDPNQVQTRTRKVLRQPEPELGNSCPNGLEERFCIRGGNCIEYIWSMSEWTSCLVNNGLSECGEGHRERFPVCRDQNDKIVEDFQCQQAVGDSLLPVVESCTIACDIDCLLSDWSPWSTCSTTCGIGNQLRIRDVVQESRGNGRFCQITREQTKPCFKQGCYTWMVSDWSLCTNQVGVCGYGTQTRNITCVTSGGFPVNSSNCTPDLDIIVLETSRSCKMPCPGECIVTEWSEWNECFLDCNDYNQINYTRGVQSRSRSIRAYSQLKNKPCPEQLWESRPCTATQCYTFHWRKSNWTRETREVWCERSDGMRVTGGCPKHLRPATVLRCESECSVENSYCDDTNLCICTDRYIPVYNRLGELLRCKMTNDTNADTTTSTITLPEDGASNVWMYAVIVAATVFVIILAAACYTMSEFFTKGPRPRKKDEEKNLGGADSDSIEQDEICKNHVARSSGVNIVPIDAISADRTPPPSVGAHVCMVMCDENGSMSEGMHENPPSVGQHVVSVKHDNNDIPDGFIPNAVNREPRHIGEPVQLSKYVGEPVEYSAIRMAGSGRASPIYSYSSVDTTENVWENSPGGEMLSQIKPKTSSTLKSHVSNDRNNMLVPKLNLDADNRSQSHHPENNSLTAEDIHMQNFSSYKSSEETESEALLQADIPNQDVVYLNREASEPELNARNRQSTGRLGHMLQEYFDKKWTPSVSHDEPLEEEERNDHEQVPLIRKNYSSSQIQRIQRPELANIRSHSLDKQIMNGYDTDLSLTGNRSDSDESLDQTQSVRSHVSGRSRLSNLSVSSGPSISIEPKHSVIIDVNQNTLPKGQGHKKNAMNINAQRKQKPNISNIAFSSFESETSTAPSTSVSCESLSPRSLPSETSEYSMTDRRKHQGILDEKTGRNIAIDSLKHKRGSPALRTKNGDVHSKPGNEYKNGHENGMTDNVTLPTPTSKRKIQGQNGVAPNSKPSKGLDHNAEAPTSKSPKVQGENVVSVHHNKKNGAVLMTPFHYQNGK